ncbi:hypothetical protein V8F33_012036 [Rhypophila sp. PSN 637]
MVVLQFTCHATALPSNAGLSTAQLHHVIGGITWTGHIFAHDEHETTLRGDANQIWEQILAINLDYEKEIGLHPQQPSNKFNMTASKDAGDGKMSLYGIKNRRPSCSVAPTSNNRVACSNNCGIWLKNPSVNYWTGDCADMAREIVHLRDACPLPPIDFGGIPMYMGWFGGEVQYDDHSTFTEHDDC